MWFGLVRCGSHNGYQKDTCSTEIGLCVRNMKTEFWIDSHTRATPKTQAAPITKNISPTYSPEMQGYNFSWLELLEWLEEGGSLATNISSQLKSQPYISGEYVGLMFLIGPPGVALVSSLWEEEGGGGSDI